MAALTLILAKCILYIYVLRSRKKNLDNFCWFYPLKELFFPAGGPGWTDFQKSGCTGSATKMLERCLSTYLIFLMSCDDVMTDDLSR